MHAPGDIVIITVKDYVTWEGHLHDVVTRQVEAKVEQVLPDGRLKVTYECPFMGMDAITTISPSE